MLVCHLQAYTSSNTELQKLLADISKYSPLEETLQEGFNTVLDAVRQVTLNDTQYCT